MPFQNRIRLPFYLRAPQWPATSNVFRRADGSLKVLSAVVRKTYEGETDYMPEAWHERLRIALMHDNVQIEGQKLVGKVALEGEGYEVEWQRFQDYPTAKANFTIQVGDYNFSNDNCQTCEEATQLSLTDDSAGARDEGDSFDVNVAANDTVFCSPAVWSITSVNPLYVVSADISQAGVISFVLKTPAATATSVLLATYRVTCPNGGYDEADVYADITGSQEACSIPENVVLDSPVTSTTAIITWDENGSPSDGYYWELRAANNLGAVVVSNTTPLGFPQANLSGLTPCTDYILFVKAVCASGVSESPFAQFAFTTECPSAGCGLYQLDYDNGMPETESFRNIFYKDCAGNSQVVSVFNTVPRFICAIENAPGDPVQIVGSATVTYIEPCQ